MAVKALVWLAMGVALVGGMFWGMQQLNADQGQLIGYAVSKPDGGKCQLQIMVSMMTVRFDGPTRLKDNGKPDWNHWLSEHFTVMDDTSTRVDLTKGGFKSQDISEGQAGTAEFIALGVLEAGKTYTARFTPVVGEPETYVHTIEGAAKAFRRTTFKPEG